MKNHAALLLMGVALFSAGSAIADPAAPVAAASTAVVADTQPDIDTSIPDAPGFTVIGLNPTAVLDPGAARVTWTQVLSYLDDKGNLKPGVALGGRPYFWFAHPARSVFEARVKSDPLLGLAARTSISVGYASGGTDQPNRVGLGFSTELLADADTRMDNGLEDCVRAAYNHRETVRALDRGAVLPLLQRQADEEWDAWKATGSGDVSGLPPITGSVPAGADVNSDAYRGFWVTARRSWLVQDAEAKKYAASEGADPVYEKAVVACYDQQKKTYANRQSWIVAGGVAIDGASHLLKTARIGGGSIWTAYRRPLGGVDTAGLPNYLTLFGRYDFNQIAGAAPTQQTFNKETIALVLGYDRPEKRIKVSFQGGYQRVAYQTIGPLTSSAVGFYTVALDYQIATGVYVELKGGSGAPDPKASGLRAGQFTVNIRYAPGSK